MHEHKSAFPSNTLLLVQQLSNALLPIVLASINALVALVRTSRTKDGLGDSLEDGTS